MNKKFIIIFGAVATILLLVSTTAIPALQNTALTASTTVQQPISTTYSINSKTEAVVVLQKIVMSTSNANIKTLASQGIAILKSPFDPVCAYLATWLTAWAAAVAYLWYQCDQGDMTACGMAVVYSAVFVYVYGIYRGLGCGILPNSISSQACPCALAE